MQSMIHGYCTSPTCPLCHLCSFLDEFSGKGKSNKGMIQAHAVDLGWLFCCLSMSSIYPVVVESGEIDVYGSKQLQ